MLRYDHVEARPGVTICGFADRVDTWQNQANHSAHDKELAHRNLRLGEFFLHDQPVALLHQSASTIQAAIIRERYPRKVVTLRGGLSRQKHLIRELLIDVEAAGSPTQQPTSLSLDRTARR